MDDEALAYYRQLAAAMTDSESATRLYAFLKSLDSPQLIELRRELREKWGAEVLGF
ncbi:MAG: hypothetical protein R3C05_13395 [Pirellulaceae bacterium]